jgi:predicted phage-related endonuclease
MTMNRMGFIGGSDAYRIMKGDWLALYREKAGLAEPEDLTGIFKVQLGVHTERFHAAWIATKHGLDLTEIIEPLQHIEHDFIRGNPDRWLDSRKTFLDLKHSNERATPRSITETYLPQMAHYCMILGIDTCYVSTIPGNDEPFITKIEVPQQYMDELLEHELRFWWHVTNLVPPDIAPTAALERTTGLAKLAKVDGMRFVDMSGNNAWANAAATVIETAAAVEAHDKARATLKELVAEDVSEATGHGVTIKRDKRGALRFTIREEAAQ